jgi:D-sedoheptulose 7-phosphate isomerase
MAIASGALVGAAEQAFARRVAPGRALTDAGPTVAHACHDMALRFQAGGTLVAFGNGEASTDAQHLSVEFVHPVIVGKRALPGISLVTDPATLTGVAQRIGFDGVFAHQLGVLAGPDDIALGVSSDGNCTNVLRGLERARSDGMLTIALVGGDGGAIAESPAVDHVVVVPSADVHVVKEMHVAAYHILWELVHVFLEHPGLGRGESEATPSGPGGVEGLYPFLYEGTGDLDALFEEVSRSTTQKATEIVTLREQVGADEADAISACAAALVEAFDAGGKLLSFGNGGSSSDAQEIARCFIDPVDEPMRPLPARCLTDDVAVITALSNDVDFEVVFSRQVKAFGRPGDIAVGLSTSGNSPNVMRAFEAAKEQGMLTIGLAGNQGGTMAQTDTIDHLFVVPSSSVHRIQEVQTTLYHVLRELTHLGLSA